MSLGKIILELNKIAGKHGVGIVYIVEDRLVGVKNCGVYEQPAAHVIIKAHKALEQYVLTRTLNEMLDTKWSYLCYGALWYDPAMEAINAFNNNVNERVSGEVPIKFYKGKLDIVVMKSPYAFGYTSFNSNEGYNFNVNAGPGFIEIFSLQMRMIEESS